MKNNQHNAALETSDSIEETKKERGRRLNTERKRKQRERARANPLLAAHQKQKRQKWERELLAKNPDYFLEKNRSAYRRNRERRLALAAEYRNNNKEILRERQRVYREHNPEKNRAKTALNRAIRNNAWPEWCARGDFKRTYAEAAKLTKETGIRYEVDHIVPIKGKTVCGLHVPWNLRVVTFEENRTKRAKFNEADGLHPTLANGILKPE